MIDAKLRSQIEPHALALELAAGDMLFQPGDPCRNFLLVTAGTARVEMSTHTGRDLVLYRVRAGETCALTITCLLSDQRYTARGIADTDLSGLALPTAAFEQLLAESAAFRRNVFRAFGERMQGLMSRLEDVLSHGLDPRLARLLLASADREGCVHLTHHRIAVELAAAREAVSRRLKGYERAGWIQVGRGRIRILDTHALDVLAEDPDADKA